MAQNFKIVDDGIFDLPKMGQEEGTSYGWFDRWQIGQTQDGLFLTDYADWEARDLYEMLERDYKAKQIENVLSLPIMSAEHKIVPGDGDTGEAAWLDAFWKTDPLQGGCRTSLDQIIGLCTSAFYYKRAYFEKVFVTGTGQFAGKVVYGDVAFRPQTTCRIMREPINGRYRGFEQEAYYVGPEIRSGKQWPIQIRANRAFVFTHGTRKDPLNGTSDMEVAYWAYKTKQKILLLWFQFLQGVSLPRTVVKAQDITVARKIAQEIARMKGSGVLPVSTGGDPNTVDIDVLDMSGKGGDQFVAVIKWLDQCATQAILAGFLDLTSIASDGHGSYALSNDASDFFLQSLEAKTRELEDQIRSELFAPLIYHNFGPNAVVPHLQFEPLNDIDKTTAVSLLQSAMAMPPGGPVPSDFIAGLAGQVSTYLGLDGQQMQEAFKQSFDSAAALAKAQALASMAPAGGATPVGQRVAGLAGAVSAAQNAVANGAGAHDTDTKMARQQFSKEQQTSDMLHKATEDSLQAKTGGRKSLHKPGQTMGPKADLAFSLAEPRDHKGRWTFRLRAPRNDGGPIVTAFDSDTSKVVGVLATDSQHRISTLWVKPEQRHQGIGTAMYRHAKRHIPDLTNHPDRSDEGDAFARAVMGADYAPRSHRESPEKAEYEGSTMAAALGWGYEQETTDPYWSRRFKGAWTNLAHEVAETLEPEADQ